MVRILFVCAAAGLIAGAQTRIEFDLASPEAIHTRLQLDSRSNQERLAALRSLFEAVGCKDAQLSEQPVKHADSPNLVCTLPGESDSMIVIGGHFDAVFTGKGIADNWSGASLLPSIFQALVRRKPRHTLVFVGFAGEEKGLVGSEAYLKQFRKEDYGRIRAMINMDTLGLGPAVIWLSHADPRLAKMIADVSAAFKVRMSAVNVDQVGSSDSETFRKRKIPAITVHSITQETLGILHSKNDQYAAIHLDDYYESYRLMTAYVAYLDLKLDPASPAGGTSEP